MRYPRLLLFSLLCLLAVSLLGQMTPNAPIKNFRLPRFADNGYTQWVLQGAQGTYDSAEQVRVDEMAMRVYSGDERMALELSMDSPKGTLRLKENRGYSDAAIEIVGANFKISGVGWTWSGDKKEVVVQQDTVVTFKQGIAGAFVDPSTTESGTLGETEIHSERLVLRTTEAAYYFEFSGGVRAVSKQMEIQSEQLIALADAPAGRADNVAAEVASEKLDSIHQIIAREQVTILQGGKTVKAQEAEFFPREQRAELSGAASVSTKGAYLSGETIHSQTGEIVLAGAKSSGRAQMILTETGGLGIQGADTLSSETIVLADTITMRELKGENHFLFQGAVEVMSGSLQLRATRMQIVANKAKPAASAQASESDLKVGEVKNIVAEGAVRIEQSGQVATGAQVVFYPSEERAVLTGYPKVTNGDAVVTGQSMELKPGRALIQGKADDPLVVRMPQLPDLGYKAFAKGDRSKATKDSEPEPEIEPEPTVITSQTLRMIEEPEQTVFRFSDAVKVTATNLETTCERLNVFTRERASSDPTAETALELERIEAHQDVVIQQTGRTATSKRAIIRPEKGEVVLEGSVVVNDERGRVAGHRMTLLQGQRRAIVEGGGPDKERARITLPAMPGSK